MGRKTERSNTSIGSSIQFWRFVFVQQVMGKELQTFLEYPPMQRGASFNLDALKAEMASKMAAAEKAAHGPSD